MPSSRTISQFHYPQTQLNYKPNSRKSLTWARSSNSTVSENRDHEAQVITFILTGGPKWNFRIRQLNNSNRVVVSKVFKGPAEKAGLKVNDEVLSVNNVPLSDEPQSLLLSDHPEQQQHLASALLSLSSGNEDNKTQPAGADPSLGSDGALAKTIADVALGSQTLKRNPVVPPIELSKLDFAFQLIKHSSVSNKLVLTIKRYSNAQNRGFAQISSGQNQNVDQICANQPKTNKLYSLGGVHYSYRCCECYCDNEGKFMTIHWG